MECLEKKVSLAHRPILTRKQFLDSYCTNRRALHGAEVLDQYNVFDDFTQTGEECIAYNSKKLPAITLLGLYSHFSGFLGAAESNYDGYYSRFFASLGRKQEKNPLLLDYFNQQLGLTFLGEQRKNTFSLHGSNYARLLYLLSFSASLEPNFKQRNTKNERGALLPSYLTGLVNEYSAFNEREQRLALRYIRDILAVFVNTKASTEIADSTIRLNLPSHRRESIIRTEAEFLMKSFELAYPSLNLTQDNLHISSRENHNKAEYNGYITIDAVRIYKTSSINSLFPLRVYIVPAPFFSFQSINKSSGSVMASQESIN
ncbi:MAG: hypothetical protein AABW65_01060 [Nanoarchaeota archaeon]